MKDPAKPDNRREYDATFTVVPTSRFGHSSDTVLATVEMLVINDQAEDITFPFVVLNTDSGNGAESRQSVAPTVLNGSRPVELAPEEIDEAALAEVIVQRAQAAGVTDAAQLDSLRTWGRTALARAERTHVGRTRIKAGETRRLVLQQRIRVQPDAQGRFVFETIAPSPIATLVTGGRDDARTIERRTVFRSTETRRRAFDRHRRAPCRRR